ncbi:MAG: copper chaperone PCu(A)C [Betaproteobacteria bacterium]
MKKLLSSVAILIGVLLASSAGAQNASSAGLGFDAPWVRASAPGQKNGAGYVQIQNKSGQTDRLISATTANVGRVELHTIINENGVAKMRQVQGIEVAEGADTRLEPGGFHIMFIGLNAPFKAGEIVPVTLRFEKAGEVKVDFEIKPPTYNPASTGQSAGHKH